MTVGKNITWKKGKGNIITLGFIEAAAGKKIKWGKRGKESEISRSKINI